MRKKAHILIIGGGGTGGALAHDLTLRGFNVTLCEKGELLSGTTGRHHGLLHSGARYVVHDPAAARECIVENRILRKIAPGCFEENDGLFVAFDDEDMTYYDRFIEACGNCGVPADVITPRQALQWEPQLNPDIKAAVRVPDAVMDAWRLPMRFFATARRNGAKMLPYHEAESLIMKDGHVTGARLLDLRHRKQYAIEADLVVLATGAWSAQMGSRVGIEIPVQPAPGVMVAVAPRLVNMVINRMRPAGDGDIIVPQRQLTILGTSIEMTDNPEPIQLSLGQAGRMIEMGSEMVPAAATAAVKAVWWAARPLLSQKTADGPQKISRRLLCIDHLQRDGIDGLVSIIGGKATTLRAMAEAGADLIGQKLGYKTKCRTETTSLLPYRAYYH